MTPREDARRRFWSPQGRNLSRLADRLNALFGARPWSEADRRRRATELGAKTAPPKADPVVDAHVATVKALEAERAQLRRQVEQQETLEALKAEKRQLLEQLERKERPRGIRFAGGFGIFGKSKSDVAKAARLATN